MRRTRNVAFIVLAVLVSVAQGTVDGKASCPTGCACEYTILGNTQALIDVDCWQVYDCGTTYPDFCDDPLGTLWDYCQTACDDIEPDHIYSACHYTWEIDWWFDYIPLNCEEIGGCWGQCACAHNTLTPCPER